MTIYELTDLIRQMAYTLALVEKDKDEGVITFDDVFQWIVDRIDNAEKEDKAKRVDATMADWLTKPKGMSPVQMSSSKHNYDTMTILQLLAADLISKTEAREMLGLSERLRDF